MCIVCTGIILVVCKGYEVAKDFDPFKIDLTHKLQKVESDTCCIDMYKWNI